MKLTPIDIQQQQFRSVFKGLAPKEVTSFLDLVAGEFEDLIKENNALKEEIRRKDAQLEEFHDRERTLKDTLITAQKMTEEVKRSARKEAEILIGEAELKAEKLVQGAQQRLVRIIDEIHELKRQKARFQGGLASLIETHRKLLESYDEETAAFEDRVAVLHRREEEIPASGDDREEREGRG